jgi:hypothetical protein
VWSPVGPDVTFVISGAGADRIVTAEIANVPPDALHRFRITPRGTVDGPSVVVESLDSGAQRAAFAEASTSAVLRWEDPAVGAATITGYRIERSTDGASWATVDATPSAVGNVRTVELTGLPAAAARRFRVTALHGAHDGSATELPVVARGGDTVALVDGEVVHAFTTIGNSTFALTDARSLSYLVVGGGGGGGNGANASADGGGGGAGGLVFVPGAVVAAADHPVVVGAGGQPGLNGGDSSVLSVTALGGGGGGGARTGTSGRAGGSGGGGEQSNDRAGGAGLQPSQAGLSGSNGFGSAGATGGGGGGAGSAGGTNLNGGQGRYYGDIFGDALGDSGWFASGGAAQGGAASIGGGADGQSESARTNADAGQNGTGGGGGGANDDANQNGGLGGSGIVVLRYALVVG